MAFCALVAALFKHGVSEDEIKNGKVNLGGIRSDPARHKTHSSDDDDDESHRRRRDTSNEFLNSFATGVQMGGSPEAFIGKTLHDSVQSFTSSTSSSDSSTFSGGSGDGS